jgi:hypothetical protein
MLNNLRKSKLNNLDNPCGKVEHLETVVAIVSVAQIKPLFVPTQAPVVME